MPLLGIRGAASVKGFGFGFEAAASRPTVIGQAFGGGYYAGKISTAGNGVADYYLVVAPLSSGQSTDEFQTEPNSPNLNIRSVIDGPTNTNNMQSSSSYSAARFCKRLTIGGYSDWYMPAKNELEVCYYNLKPTTQDNDTRSGANANAVPSRGKYSSESPAQTSATAFINGGAQAFESGFNYWSSTETSATTASRQLFNNGYQSEYSKPSGSTRKVRAVRRVAV
jgi:hypothetical protein